MPKFRTAYDGKRHGVDDVDFSDDEGLTRQAHKDECDINNIMGQYLKSGLITHVREHEGEYGEYAEMDFHEAMNTVANAQSMFETIPAEIRNQFGNDPGAFIKFATDEKNRDQMVEMGLIPDERRHETVPASTTVASPPPPPASPPETAPTGDQADPSQPT